MIVRPPDLNSISGQLDRMIQHSLPSRVGPYHGTIRGIPGAPRHDRELRGEYEPRRRGAGSNSCISRLGRDLQRGASKTLPEAAELHQE